MTTAGEALRRLASAMDGQAWDRLEEILDPGLTARFRHTDETFDRAGYVALNRDYPGDWRFEAEEIVDAGERAALRARISDAHGRNPDVYVVAAFATVGADGRITSLEEVWTDPVRAPDRDQDPRPEG